MKTPALKNTVGQRLAQSVMECGGKRSAAPISRARKLSNRSQPSHTQKIRRRCALPEQSKTWQLALLLGFLIPLSSFCLPAWGQSYSVNWSKIAGGGGASTNGTYQVAGTIGQTDASGAMSGPVAGTNDYSVTGGFWSLINVVPTPGAPNLLIIPNGLGSVQIVWPATGRYTLQQNASLSNTNWVTSGYPITTASGTNRITLTSPAGNLFFRLQP